MSKALIVMLSFLLICAPSAVLFAAQDQTTTASQTATYRQDVGQKAERGAKNALFGWTEIPRRVVDITQETKNPIWGLLAGGFQGTLKAMSRTASGVCDVVTAPVNPDKESFMQPDISVD